MLTDSQEVLNDATMLDQGALFQKFIKFVRFHKLFSRGDKVLVAMSGGLDSSVLTKLLAKVKRLEGIEVIVAHVDHGQRGEVSKREATWVRVLADQLELSFHSLRVSADVGASQDELRNLRRKALETLATQLGCRSIATAHHADDNAETFLIRAISGSGVHGLRGMRVKEGLWIKPLLCAFREELLYYARQTQLSWIEDPSNNRGKYLRNRIRNEVFPLLEDVRKSSLSNVARLAQRLDAEEAETESWLAQQLPESPKNILPLGLLERFPASLKRRLLRVWAKRLKIDAQPALLEALLAGRELIHPNGSFLRRSDHWVFTPETEFGLRWSEPTEVSVNKPLFLGSSLAWGFLPAVAKHVKPYRLSVLLKFRDPKSIAGVPPLLLNWDRLPQKLALRRAERTDPKEVFEALERVRIPSPYHKSWPLLVDAEKTEEIIAVLGVEVMFPYRYRNVGRCVAFESLFEEGLSGEFRS